jgi:hypothetical protein
MKILMMRFSPIAAFLLVSNILCSTSFSLCSCNGEDVYFPLYVIYLFPDINRRAFNRNKKICRVRI